MEQFKDAYEISLWGDVPVAASGSGDNEIPAHYEEEKIGVIGSNSMTAQWRAVEPKLTQNVNGTNTFTFKMFYTYIDTITGERKDNPFQNLLVNERKVKVKWKDKWYDFVIKSCQEDSSGKSVTYTCQDQFINELSKTGFNLEFDNELGNNMGTAQELAQTVLDGTDWQLGENQDTIKQYREEPVYDITKDGIRFLVFYSVVQNHETDFQYWYDSSNQYTRDGTSMLVVNGECKSATASWSENTATVTIEEHSMEINFALLNVSDDYRAKRLVRTQETAYCPALDRYVNKYTYDNDTKVAYGYQTTVYNDPLTVRNIITNGKDFTEALGWSNQTTIPQQIYPSYTSSTDVDTYDGKSYLGLQANINTYNSAITDHLSNFSEGITKGQKYILRLKARGDTEGSPSNTYLSSGFVIFVGKFTRTSSGAYTKGQNYISNPTPTYDSSSNWITYTLTFNKSITRSDIGSNFGLIITPNQYSWIQEVEFFEYIESGNSYIIPGVVDTSGVVKTEWRYFDESQLNVINADDIEYLDYSEEPISTYNPFYGNDDSGAEKVRSISGKNSNRFNWLQTIAETFECWVKFDIEHNNDGSLIYNSGIPRKYVTFVNDIGSQTGLSFIYGIDLNTISRTINSDQIATKVIVSPNSNEFGQDGFCTIARSNENYSKTNFILDFGYYINQGMLSSGQVNLDLYDSTGINGIGYYYFLRQFNTQYDGYNEQYIDVSSQLDRYESQKTITENQIKSTEEEINYLKNRLVNLITSQTSWDEKVIGQKVKNEYANDQSVQQAWTGYISSKNNLASYRNLLTALETQIEGLKDQIEGIEAAREGILEDIAALDEKFNIKYARFIQEGSWISEDYYDDNLYYLDAESIAYTSSRPQIQYNINVLRLSALEEFKNKIFNVGDRGYVEDTEFFGYAKDANGNITNTPYKEEILISEITSVFDSPEQDTITVQNYKTQFEDLFQRITATTQSLQYNEGGYARAASIVEPTGEINSWTLAKSFEYNEQLAWRATDDSIVINTTGVTAVDTTNPQNMVRLSSAGLQISSDGGVTWTTGVSGAGISTQNLTAGSINTDNVQILSGSYPTFTWNKYGLNAYYYTTDNQNDIIDQVWSNKFVRFDRFGLYGIDNSNQGLTEIVFNTEEEVWDAAQYALTWKGFMLKTKTGAVTITSEDDISVWDQNEVNRVKIGRISGQGTQNDPYIYGIKITDEEQNIVMETDDSGYLWLKDKLHIGTSNLAYDVTIGKLNGFSYFETVDTIPQEDKVYYTFDEENQTYIEFTGQSFEQDVDYFEKISEVVNSNNNFIIYENGSIIANSGTFSGELNAATGTFNGDISAASGTFSGTIEASEGIVGGFIIGENTLSSISNNLVLRGREEYYQTHDEIPQSGKSYYIYNTETDSYILFTGNEFDSQTAYYELENVIINSNNNFLVYNDGSVLVNNGTFNGVINAVDGEFSGTVNALRGTIGGFEISDGRLISTLKDSNDNPLIQLIGNSNAESKIIVQTIELGIGALVQEYLKFPSSDNEYSADSYIYNPSKNSGLFIQAGLNNALQIYDTGIINLGDILLNGQTSRIELNSDNAIIKAGNNVTITPTRSEFLNVDVTGTLHTAVFETGKIQTVGGAMIFKEGAELDEITEITTNERYSFTTKTNISLSVGSIVLFTSNSDSNISSSTEIYGQIKAVDDNIYTVDVSQSIKNCTNILQIGDYDSESESYKNNLVIGVNSQSSTNKMLQPEAITMVDFDNVNIYTPFYNTPKLLLGNLNSLLLEGISGFGLYGENVYLTGSLVTQVAVDSYAGVNTLNGVPANKFGVEDTSKIVFWAGAKSNQSSDIQASYFQVTEKGSIYASQGVFEGALITKSSIQAASLYAAHIYGGTEQQAAALNIHDTTNGILFFNDRNNSEELRINIQGLASNNGNYQFISINNSSVDFLGHEFLADYFITSSGVETNYLKIITNEIQGVSLIESAETIYGKLKINNNNTSLSFGSQKIDIGSDIITIDSLTTNIAKDVYFGEKMQYKQQFKTINNVSTLIGYDLYVS